METVKVPSRWNYLFALLILVAGLAIFGAMLFLNLKDLGDKAVRFLVPGETQLELQQTGNYTIFYEHESNFDGRVYSTGELPGLQVDVAKAGGELVEVRNLSTNQTYQVGGREGVAVLEFTVDEPGVYVISSYYPDGQGGPEAVFAVAQEFMKDLLGTIFGSLAVLFLSGLIAVILVVVTFVRRRRALRPAAAVST